MLRKQNLFLKLNLTFFCDKNLSFIFGEECGVLLGDRFRNAEENEKRPGLPGADGAI